MFGVIDLWAYVIATVIIVLLPGPNSLYVLSVASRRGARTGWAAASGVFVGDTILMIASAAGLASVFAASPALFTVVRWAGALYLTWLGVTLLASAWRRLRRDPCAVSAEVTSESLLSRERPFRRALIASLLNPKAILFFVAFFVQFVDPNYAWPVLSYLLLGLIALSCSAAYLAVLIVSGSKLAAAFAHRRRLAAGGTSVAGAVMVGFAVRLAAGN
ncbi:leucine efflux protein LeuE [Natronoglycomyces albus]|uniref:Leucine efflux protein LeuE n=1 Tax=Natronoglycomyces albus TaxID=2811108 RepID=A0A895XN82_9ACTN|nr:leucine efflux protein LeuE [Natronoglycomyces albus]QSB06814.1 leucine efflux protein LeuE [Natronoglycomyces albus]